jgi:hypothetical protein
MVVLRREPIHGKIAVLFYITRPSQPNASLDYVPFTYDPQLYIYLGIPLLGQPPIEHVQARFGLVIRHHVSGSVYLDKSQVAARLDIASLLAVRVQIERFEGSSGVVFVSWPLEGIGPGLVSEPVADEIGITLTHAVSTYVRG